MRESPDDGGPINTRFLLSWIFLLLVNIPATAHCSDFVVRDGAKLRAGGLPFSFMGTNAYYLFMAAARGDTDAVLEVLTAARNTGMTVIRTWAFNDSPDSLDPAVIQYRPGALNESALRGLDYLIARVPEYDIRLIFALVNSWDDFGGMNQYVAWRSEPGGAVAPPAPGTPPDTAGGGPIRKYSAEQLPATVEGPGGRSYRRALNAAWGHDDFYTDSMIGSWYRNYAAMITGRVNTLTGVAYKDDPAILGWELANEPRASDRTGTIVREWIAEMSAYLQSIDTNHLVGTGEEGFDVASWRYSTSQYGGGEWLFDGTGGVSFSMNTDLATVDFAGIHLYPEFWGLPSGSGNGWISDHVRISDMMEKPLILGEFGAVIDNAAAYESWLNTAVSDGAAGAMVWQFLDSGRTDAQGFGLRCPADGRVCEVLSEAAGKFSLRDSGGNAIPSSYLLFQNYPNPFNHQTLIRYNLPEDAHVVIDIWDVRGRKAGTVFEGFQNAGERLQLFDPGGYASGAYFYRLATARFSDARKLMIVR